MFFLSAEAESSQSVIGQVSADDFSYKDAAFTKLRADFAWDGTRTMLRDIRLQQNLGALSADLYSAPNDFRFNLDSTINPGALRSLVPTDFQQFLSEWEWTRPPTMRLVIRGTSHDPSTWKGDGTLAMERTRFRGVWMNSARADLHFGDGAMTYEHLRVTRDEGVGTGSFTFDWAKHEVRLTNVQTSLRPSEAIYWVDPKFAKPVAPYKFHQPPKVNVNGVVQFHGGKNTHLEIGVEAPNGMDYIFLGKTLPVENVRAQSALYR